MNERQLQVKEVECSGVNMVACQRQDGEILVSVKSICDSLGIDVFSQAKRIKRDDVLSQGTVKMTLPSSGGDQETNMLIISFLPFFLTGIKSSMVSPDLRDKILEFKLKAKDVLAAAFLPTQFQSSEISAVLTQLKNMQAQLDQNTHSLAILADERQKHIEAITNLSYELKTQIQIHPLSDKRERVIYKLTEELFKKELTDENTSQVYNEQLSKLLSMGLQEVKRTLRVLSRKSFANEFEFQYDIATGNAPFANCKSVNNIRYKQSNSSDWAFFSMANVYVYLYYGEVLLDTGVRTRFSFPLKECNYTYSEFSKKAKCFEFNFSDYKLLAHYSLIMSKFFISIMFNRYEKLEEESQSTGKELMPLKDYLILREIICKVMYAEAGYEG